MNKDYTTIEELLTYRIDLNQTYKDQANPTGDTPLAYAATCSDIEMISYLIRHGADPLKCNSLGVRLYHLAVQMNKLDAAKLLSEYEPSMLDVVNEILPKAYSEFTNQ